AIICTPSDEAVRQAQAMLNGAGKVLLFAHTRRGASTGIDLSEICVDEKDLVGSYSSDITLQAETARILFSGKLKVNALITHRFHLRKTAEAVNLAAHPTPESLKVVVRQSPG